MEKINIAELLRDCPKDMELDCTMYEDVYFNYVDALNIIHCYIQHETCRSSITFNRHGTPNMDIKSKCVIFPKGKTTWEGFVPPFEFKNGDIVATGSGAWIGITTGGDSRDLIPTHCVIKSDGAFEAYTDVKKTWCFNRFATEEEKEKLFQAIKDNGYRWNTETKTLEKLVEPEFKVGDVIQDLDSYKVTITKVHIEEEYYEYESVIAKGIGSIRFLEQSAWELVPNKFDINTLIPFESKVLVRHNKDSKWTGSFFSFIDRDFHSHCYKFVTTADKSYPMMIPFKGNEYLLGKTDDCQDFYKIWE